MAEAVLFGVPYSTYVRTARIVLAEKGVAYALDPIDIGSVEVRGRHPFGRVPSFQHGELRLFETFAIARYVDEAFEGPPLQPADPGLRAIMTQWISVIVDPIYPRLIREYLIPYIRAARAGAAPEPQPVGSAMGDETGGETGGAIDDIRRSFAVLDSRAEESTYLAGPDFSLADAFILPILYYMWTPPETAALFEGSPNLQAYYERLAGRPSAAEILTPVT